MLKLKKPKNGVLDDARVARTNSKAKLRVTCYDPSGTYPWVEDVEVEGDKFQLKGRDGKYDVSPGSVWLEGGMARAILNTSVPRTINVGVMDDPIMDPAMYARDLDNNYLEQVAASARRGTGIKQALAWGMGLMGLVLLGLMLWGVLTLGDGLDNLAAALRDMQVATPSSSTSPPGAAAGHQPIAPGGR